MDKNNKLLFSILVLIPFVGGLLYVWKANGNDKERLIGMLGIIPAINFVCALILILSALNVVKL